MLVPQRGAHRYTSCTSQAKTLSKRVSAGAVEPAPMGAQSRGKRRPEGGIPVLWTLFAVFLILWLLGMVSSYTMGGFIHLLLVLAIVTLLVRVITGNRAV